MTLVNFVVVGYDRAKSFQGATEFYQNRMYGV